MPQLSGKTAIITGATSGIGHAAARLFANEGASIVAIGRREDRLQELVHIVRENEGKAAMIVGDVTDERTHRDAIDLAMSEFGGLHIAFNNAGSVGTPAPLADQSYDQWTEVITVNLTAAFLGARAQVPAILDSGGGAMIFTSSFVGNSVGLPGMSAYAAAKAGLMGLVRGITADYGSSGIRANALLPGGTVTEMAGDADHQEWAATLHAMKRLAKPEEIASAALFLASDMASFVSGSALWADGGNAAIKT